MGDTLIELICYNCSKVFTKPLGIYNQSKQFNTRYFCSRKCVQEDKKPIPNILCICGKMFYRNKSQLKGKLLACSNKCYGILMSRVKKETYLNKWLAGEINGTYGKDFSVSSVVRDYLHKIHNNSCQECGWSKKNPYSNRYTLQIDHVNGDWKNSYVSNLKLLCPNCHSMTPTWMSLNTNNHIKNKNKRRRR